MQPCFKKHRLSSIDFILIGWVIIGLSSLRQLLSTRTFDTLQTTRERKKKRTHVTAFVSTSFSPPWKFICNGNSACVAYILFFSEVRLFQARVVDFPLSEWPSSLKKKIESPFDAHVSAWQGCYYTRLGQEAVAALSLSVLTLSAHQQHQLFATQLAAHVWASSSSLPFGQFTRQPRSVSKGTRVTVTQSAYCTDKQTRLIQTGAA